MSEHEQTTLDETWGEMTLRRCEQCGELSADVGRTASLCGSCRIIRKRTDARERHRRTIPELRCIDCGALLQPRLGDHGGGPHPRRCTEHAADHERRRRARKEELRRYRRHGIDEATYVALLEAQAGGCAICSTDTPDSAGRSWHIDHDHRCCPGAYSCGLCVRGLLCGSCNQGIGYFQDDPVLLSLAITYLQAGPFHALKAAA